jgi:hypothetical protein
MSEEFGELLVLVDRSDRHAADVSSFCIRCASKRLVCPHADV